jgi:hypothetical protein
MHSRQCRDKHLLITKTAGKVQLGEKQNEKENAFGVEFLFHKPKIKLLEKKDIYGFTKDWRYKYNKQPL